ncbi:MAG: hypothetical protein HY815_11650, partial [Candidatus Riflebacteria bacterium]|nr:hypothetical protein [Candidatus Riflebacteria bacterium]
MRLCIVAFVLAATLCPARLGAGPAVSSPLGVVWVIRAGPLSPDEPYVKVRQELVRLTDLAVQHKARATVLVSGDVAEEAIARKHRPDFDRLIEKGFEIGTYVPLSLREGTRRWKVVGQTSRWGEHGYDAASTRRLWNQHREWVDRLVGADANRAVEALSFRCSTE